MSVTVGERLVREKRDFVSDDRLVDLYKKYKQREHETRLRERYHSVDSTDFKLSFDDNLYKKQWYLVSDVSCRKRFAKKFRLLTGK